MNKKIMNNNNLFEDHLKYSQKYIGYQYYFYNIYLKKIIIMCK